MALPEALHRASFEQSRLPQVIADSLGMPVLWNEAFESLFRTVAGVGPERLRGTLFEFLAEHEGVKLDYYAAQILLGGQAEASVQSPVRAVDGTRHWLALSLSLLETASAQFAASGLQERYVLCSIEDVTDRVLRERGLQVAKEEAEKATHTKSQFLANMSHEIRTPIQTILGVVELMEDTSLDSEQSDYVGQVKFSADVLLGLINDILDFSKIEAGKLDMETSSFELRAAVYQSADLLIMDAHRKGLEIIVDIDEALPTLIRGDQVRLRQIIVNLFKNAVKFTKEGGIRIEVRRRDAASGSWMRFEVIDTGPGVPESEQDRLFTPFFRGDFPQAKKAGGTGLGLAISRHLVELMGGTIGLSRSTEGGEGGPGSVFWFELPLVSPEYSAPPRVAVFGPVGDGGPRILVVDDHDGARKYVASLARKAGGRVSEASSGEEALALLRAAADEGEGFAACLVDQNMPRMDGWRLASEITGDTAINSVRLILMAPVGTMGADAKMKLLRWFNGYISKPVKPNELLEAVTKSLTVEVDLEAAEQEHPAERQRMEEAPRFKGEVLVAEDHEVNRELFTILLERFGCRVVTARDGVEAAELGSSRHFDLVLMDIFMPRMDGYEATGVLRSSGFAGPIIAVTASALKGEREKCIAAGMDDILVKPFKRGDLASVLETWLGAGRAPGTPAHAGARVEPARPAPVPGAAGTVATRDSGAPDGDLRASEPGWTDPGVFDWSAVLDTFLGQEATVLLLLGRFIEKARGQESELAQALQGRDYSRFREVAHSLKGAAWNLSARQLGDAALAAEDAGRAGDEDRAREALSRLRVAFAEFERVARRCMDT
ncbi:MAG TPA: response regulator [Rectinemataceae bacterium]|nr:response regulator [Rectinemataceae bacterium]